jgi:hypothetical protein
MSRHQMIDAELSQIAYLLDLIEIVNIYVTHDRADLTGNNKDDTFKQRELLEGNPNNPRDFHHPKMTLTRMAECDKLSEYMKSQGNDSTWWERVKNNEQDPWAKLKENDVNAQMRQFTMKVQGSV